MADHEIVWTHDRDTVRAVMVCSAPPEAQCRWKADCACEVLGLMGRTDSGHPYHGVQGSFEKFHVMSEGGECNHALWLNEEPDLIPELAARGQGPFEIGRTPIQVAWNGDEYEWRRV